MKKESQAFVFTNDDVLEVPTRLSMLCDEILDDVFDV